MSLIAAIDIGSNAMRLAIANPSDPLATIDKKRFPIRLGKEVFSRGSISKKTQGHVLEAFEEMEERMKKWGVQRCVAVATSAVRNASNGDELCRRILRQSGIRVDVIDGEREAELVFLAVSTKMRSLADSVALIDIGGGSVEVSSVYEGALKKGRSFPLGTVRLLQTTDRLHLNENHLNVLIGEHVEDVHNFLTEHSMGQYSYCVGTGGNIETLGKLRSKLLGKSNTGQLSASDLQLIANKLRSISVQQRIDSLGLRPDRADVIVPALLVVQMVMRQAGVDCLKVPYVGLRDGVLCSMSLSTPSPVPEVITELV